MMVTTTGAYGYSQAQSLASSVTQQTSLFGAASTGNAPKTTAEKVAAALQKGDTAGAIGAFVDEKTLKKLTKLQADATQLDKQLKQKSADNDKKAAQDKVDNAKRQLKALRMRAQLAAAMGDKQAAARIAREAADVAKSLGSAAQEYAGAVKNGATVGTTGGDSSAATGASGASGAGTGGAATGGAATDVAGVGSDAAQIQATAAGTQNPSTPQAGGQAATAQAVNGAGADATLQTGDAQAAANDGKTDKPGVIQVPSTEEETAARKERMEFMGNVRTLMDQARSVYAQAKNILERKRKPGDPQDADHSARDIADAAKQVDAADQDLAAGTTPAAPTAPTVVATPNNTLLLV
ncbi:hypothetical protein UAJ10_18795 [Nitrospirillum sp. BR 11164]|uniref:hypothetical protein n=1 Tax=Nitrospirillum sp. BR 11164 TaxID=3104324 RepID=UPI002AFF58C2|nr:hypothetical protein [Nitrospirillum sp. BR 11164]MEA1651059.1 hypothetical protein [Nitrospirillum sp. BR 11164]